MKNRTARVEVALVLIGVALLSMLLVAGFNYMAARTLLADAAETQLVDIGAARGAAIEAGVRNIKADVATLAADRGIVIALRDLADGFAEVDEKLTADQEAELISEYDAAIAGVVPPGYEAPSAESMAPATERGRYLQYQYIVQNPYEADDRAGLVDSGAGTTYDAAHALHHPDLRALVDTTAFGDLLLVDATAGDIVYTVDKRVDFATNIVNGPYQNSALATAVVDELQSAAAGEAVVIDVEPYAPAALRPTVFVAAAVRDGTEVVGALAVELPGSLISAVTTAGGDWEETGLGRTGEVYIVGTDGRMRSESRLWLESPDEYLEAAEANGYDDEILQALEAFDTTVLIQPVETEPALAALAGDAFAERSTNYLDVGTLSVAAPLDVEGLGWVAVAEVETSEVYEPVRDYERRTLLAALILIPLVAAAGYYLTRRLLRPIAPIAAVAHEVSIGSLEVRAEQDSGDEFGALGAELNGVIDTMLEQERSLVQTDEDITELLMAVLPTRLVDDVKRGRSDIAEAMKNATLVAITVDQADQQEPDDELELDVRVTLSQRLAEIAETYGLEALQRSASQQLFAAGLNSQDPEAADAVAFATEARTQVIAESEAHGLRLDVRAGLAAGDVIAGVVGTERMSFDVWGEPARLAAGLAAVANPGQILVDSVVAKAIGTRWDVQRQQGLVDLSGGDLAGWAVGAKLEAAETPSDA